MNILVTGAAGLIGRRVCKSINQMTNHSVVAVDLFAKPDLGFGSIQTLDLTNTIELEHLFKINSFDAVIHLAGNIDPNRSMIDPISFYRGNVGTTLELIRFCIKYGVDKFIFPSSAAVYGLHNYEPVKENETLNPLNPYSRSKAMCEQVLQDAAMAHPQFKFVTMRLFFVVADEEDVSHASSINENVIRIIAQAALGTRERFVIYGDQFGTPDGTCVRDFIHVGDVSSFVIASLEYLESGNASSVINCGTGKGYSIRQLVSAMSDVSGVKVKVEVDTMRDMESESLIADITRATVLLSWTPKSTDLESFCRFTLDLERKYLASSR